MSTLRTGQPTDFEIVEHGDAAIIVRCQHCGHEQCKPKKMAVARERIVCDNCGREKSIDAPTSTAFGLVVLLVILAPVYLAYRRLRAWIFGN